MGQRDKTHHYRLAIVWTGNTGAGTAGYSSFERSYEVLSAGKPAISGSSDPAFRGDRSKHHPEDLLLASLSSCHMLWYLHLCSENGIVVTAYTDQVSGLLEETPHGAGKFSGATLRPRVIVAESSMIAAANALHKEAGKYCFIANSVNFPVDYLPECNAERS